MPKKRGRGPGGQYLPTTGMRTDFKRLMNKFLAHQTVRFEHFKDVWREKNMSFLCAGRCSDREAREFVERVMLIAQEYFLPPYQFQVRVGGLYLLYAIYQIQPVIPKVKIRITPTQWQDTIFFQLQAAQQNHLDVVYVFQRLLHEQAFLFCYTPSEMSVNTNMKELADKEENLADDLREEKSVMNSLFSYESLEKLSYLLNQYQRKKVDLSGPGASKPHKSLDVAGAELVEDVVVLLQTFKETVSSISKHGKKGDGTGTVKEFMTETTGGRRQLIKSQAYKHTSLHGNKLRGMVITTASPSRITADETAHMAEAGQTDRSHARKNSQRPVSGTGTSDDDHSSMDEDDEDFLPPMNLQTDSQKKQAHLKWENKTIKTPEKKATKAMKPVTYSPANMNSQTTVHYSMPILDLGDQSVPSFNHNPVKWVTPRKGNQAVGFSEKENALGNNLPVTGRKRGRPRKSDIPVDHLGANFKQREGPSKSAEVKCSTKEFTTFIGTEGGISGSVRLVPAPKRGRPRKHNGPTEIIVTPKSYFHQRDSDHEGQAKTPPVAMCLPKEIDTTTETDRTIISVTENHLPAPKRGRPRKSDSPREKMIPPKTYFQQTGCEQEGQTKGPIIVKCLSREMSNSTETEPAISVREKLPAPKRGRPKKSGRPQEIIVSQKNYFPQASSEPEGQTKAPTIVKCLSKEMSNSAEIEEGISRTEKVTALEKVNFAAKKGRPKKYYGPTEIIVTPNTYFRRPASGQEMSSAIVKCLPKGMSNYSGTEDRSVTEKVSFKWKKAERSDETHLLPFREGSAKAVLTPRKRGRPRTVHPAVNPPEEIRVYPKSPINPENLGSLGGKYEVVYYHTGQLAKSLGQKTKSTLPESAEQTTGKAAHTTQIIEPAAASAVKIVKPLGKKQRSKLSATPEPVLRQVTEVVVGKEVGRDAIIQSIKTHKILSVGAHSQNKISEVSASKAENQTSTKELGSAPPKSTIAVKAVSESTQNAIQRLKESCKRKREEREEPVKEVIKKHLLLKKQREAMLIQIEGGSSTPFGKVHERKRRKSTGNEKSSSTKKIKICEKGPSVSEIISHHLEESEPKRKNVKIHLANGQQETFKFV